MRKTAFLTLGALLLISGSMSAQENDEVRYNQYGVAVDRKELHTEARNNILVMESKDQSYKLWMDNRVQVDGASFWGAGSDFDKIGNGVSTRRVRFAIKAQITKDWYGEVDMDMADGVFELKDAIIEYDGIPANKYLLGDFRAVAAALVDYTNLTLEWAEDVETKLTNQVVLIAQEEIIFPVYNPWAFAYGDLSALKTAVTKA